MLYKLPYVIKKVTTLKLNNKGSKKKETQREKERDTQRNYTSSGMIRNKPQLPTLKLYPTHVPAAHIKECIRM